MKLINAVVRPERLPQVKAALFQVGVTGPTISRVGGHGGELDLQEHYRGSTVVLESREKVLLQIAVSEPFVEPTIRGRSSRLHAPVRWVTERSSSSSSSGLFGSARAR
jgi:nitrogen regulatory protein P-II 1